MNKQELCNRLENKIDTLTQKLNTVSDLLHVLLEQSGKVVDFDLHTCDECIECEHWGIDEDGVYDSRCQKKERRVNRNDEACRHFDPIKKGAETYGKK